MKVCRYCGEDLIGPGNGRGYSYIAPNRLESPRSVIGVTCNDGECLNAAGQVTCHEPVKEMAT
jgi:hypothetical protein